MDEELTPSFSLPSYLAASDLHNIANGNLSITNSDLGYDPYNSESNIGKFAAAATVRAITSIGNAVLAPARWMGVDSAEIDTANVLRKFDDNLAAYYEADPSTIDVVGDVVGMFVPGMAGVKLLNKAQSALKGMEYSGYGSRLLKGFGALPDQTAIFAEKAAQSAKQTGLFASIDANVVKSLGSAYAQNAVEMGAFEIAAASSMGTSPLFENHDASDILYNSLLGGGVVGFGVMGTVSAVQSYGAISRARAAVDSALNKFRYVNESPAGADEWVNLLNLKHEISTGSPFMQTLPSELGGLENAAIRANEAKVRDVKLSIEKGFQKLAAGDRELAGVMSEQFIRMNPDDAFAAHVDLIEIGRLNTTLQAEKRIEQAENKIAAAIEAGIEPSTFVQDTVKFVKLWGDDAGEVTLQHTGLPRVGDLFSRAEVEAKIARLAKKMGTYEGWNPAEASAADAELRYLAARKINFAEGDVLAPRDLPMLEAAYDSKMSSFLLDGIKIDKVQLYSHIKQTKEELALEMLAREAIDPALTPQKIARILNMKEELLITGVKRTDDSGYFALQSYTGGNFEKAYTPSVAKVAYAGDSPLAGISFNEVRGMQAVRTQQMMQQGRIDKTLEQVWGRDVFEKLNVPIFDTDIIAASSKGAGARALSFASGDYGTLAAKAELLGKVTNQMKVGLRSEIQETFNSSMIALKGNNVAASEVAAARALVHQTGMPYVLRQNADGVVEMVLKDVAEHEAAIAAGKASAPPSIPAGITPSFAFTQKESADLMTEWVRYNGEHLRKVKAQLNAQGRGMGNYEDRVYFPQPDSSRYTHFSFVVPKNPEVGQAPQMIWAKDAQGLADLESKVPREYEIIRKGETERFHKVKGDYDSSLGMNSLQTHSELQRTGAAGAFFPRTNPTELVTDMMEFRYKQADKLVRDAVELKFSKQVQELRRMDLQYKDLYQSSKERVGKTSPFETYIRTMLDIPANSKIPVWTDLNEISEAVTTKAWNALKGYAGKAKGKIELDEMNAVLDRAGLRGFSDAMTEAWASHPADKAVLSKVVSTNNSLFSLMVLGADPLNAVNNGIGHSVLLWPETRRLIEKSAEVLSDPFFGKVGVPGTQHAVVSPTKLISQAYGDWSKYLAGDATQVERFKYFDKQGWLPSMADQMRSVYEGAALTGKETTSQLQAWVQKGTSIAQEWLPKVTGNKFAEEMNRFVAASVADSIVAPMIAAGRMGRREADAYINTFINRTQGNYLASQRPLAFQGPLGHAVSLFQTYSFNLYQNLFRHIADGNKKSALTLMGLQSGIYGMNGLPMFNFMNEHLVGNAAGNRSHSDVFSTVQDVAGQQVGDWLLYGSLSNATNMGLYSRGDLNPRQITILPSNVRDVPFISAYTGFFGQLFKTAGEIGQGADVSSSLLRGIEHAGINRPLAGLATVLQGMGNPDGMMYSTTGKNSIVAAAPLDVYDLSMWSRIAGARPLDEAKIRDAYHRVQVYSGAEAKKVASLGSAIRDRVRNGEEVGQEEFEDFLSNYVKAGGDQKHFQKFWMNQVKNAHTSQIEKMAELGKSPSAQYLQKMLGGIDLNEFTQ